MEVEDKTMFHIHTNNKYDEMWQEGKEIIVDNNFESYHVADIPYFDTNVICSDGTATSMSGFLNYYLNKGVENLDTYCIKQLLEDCYRIINNTNRIKCETALEICRRNKYKFYPSRFHSIWVTDEDYLEYWKNILNGKAIYELNLTGTLFKSSDIYIPDDNLNLSQSIERADMY